MATTPPRIQPTFEQTIRTLYAIAFASLIALLIIPFRFGLLRMALIACTALLYLGGIYLLRRSRWAVPVAIVPAALLAAIVFLPGRPVDRDALRDDYVQSLRALRGTVYLWGGETHLGIDCSGLIRLGMIDAELKEGLKTANPGLIRAAADLWWHDCSAKAIGDEYRGLTYRIADAKDLDSADYSLLRPGDVAVMDSGVHILAYIGNRTWIQADPVPMRVVTTKIPSKEGWFGQQVRLLRWTPLESPSADATRNTRSLPE